MPNFLLGRDARAYFSTTILDGTNEAATLTAATAANNIIDLSLDIGSEFVDSTTRAEASQGFASQIAVLRNGQITFEARWLPGDTFFDALIDVWDGTTAEIAFFALDQDKATVGSQGLVGNFTVGMAKTEPLRDVQKVNVTMSISSFPQWWTVS